MVVKIKGSVSDSDATKRYEFISRITAFNAWYSIEL